MPLAIVFYAAFCMASGFTPLPGRGAALILHGRAAVFQALAYASVGLFIHFHFFWGAFPRLWQVVDIAKAILIIVFIGCLGHTMWWVICY